MINSLIKQYIIYENDEFIVFKREDYDINLKLIKQYDCKWCSDNRVSWDRLIDVGNLYGIIEKDTNELYSALILHDGTLRRLINSKHINIHNNKLKKLIINLAKNG